MLSTVDVSRLLDGRRQSDLLKANSFAEPNFLTDNFVQRNGPKMPLNNKYNFEEFCQNVPTKN